VKCIVQFSFLENQQVFELCNLRRVFTAEIQTISKPREQVKAKNTRLPCFHSFLSNPIS